MTAILVFFCLLANQPLLPSLKENILLNFEFKNGATRANLQVNKRTRNWRPLWNKVYLVVTRTFIPESETDCYCTATKFRYIYSI